LDSRSYWDGTVCGQGIRDLLHNISYLRKSRSRASRQYKHQERKAHIGVEASTIEHHELPPFMLHAVYRKAPPARATLSIDVRTHDSWQTVA
jgi:hypothetical protein